MTLTTTPAGFRVIKFGGSLLSEKLGVESQEKNRAAHLVNCTARLETWLSAQALRRNILIVGGGNEVERLRREQNSLGLTDEQAHWRAIEIMDCNTTMMADRIAIEVVEGFSELFDSVCNTAFRCANWMQSRTNLPCDWSITSDSIAATLAGEIFQSAERDVELVLLKSVLPGSSDFPESGPSEVVIDANSLNLGALVEQGYVDSYFPTAVVDCDFRIRLVVFDCNLDCPTGGNLDQAARS